MKTPEQIAAEVVRFHRGRPDSQTVANLPGIVAQAINADRAQREHSSVEVAVFDADIDDAVVVQIDTNASRRYRINLNDAPVWDGNPEDAL